MKSIQGFLAENEDFKAKIEKIHDVELILN